MTVVAVVAALSAARGVGTCARDRVVQSGLVQGGLVQIERPRVGRALFPNSESFRRCAVFSVPHTLFGVSP